MKISNPIRRVACVIALSACATTSAFAKDSGFYLGAGFGVSKYDSDVTGGVVFPISTSTETDDSDLSYSLSGGYRFNSYLGLELSLSNLGKAETHETGFVSVTPTSVGGFSDILVDVRGPSLAAVGSFPVGKFEFFGKVGAMYAQTSIDVRFNSIFGTSQGALIGKVDSESTEVLYGVGVGYNINDDFFLNLEWMRVQDAGDEDDLPIDEFNVDTIAVKFQYRF